MHLADLLEPGAVCGNLQSKDKKSVLFELAKLVNQQHPQVSSEEVFDVLVKREKLGSTDVGHLAAIPHGKVDSLEKMVCAFGRSKKGITFCPQNNKSTYFFFVLLAPSQTVSAHLQALARLSRLLNQLKNENLIKTLTEIQDDEVFEFLIEQDQKL